MNLKSDEIKRLLLNTYSRYRKGELSHTSAKTEALILNSLLKAIQLSDLERKLESIESILKKNEEYQ